MRTYTEEFKKTIVELYESGNKNKSELAREYGTSEGNVRAWIKKYGKINFPFRIQQIPEYHPSFHRTSHEFFQDHRQMKP